MIANFLQALKGLFEVTIRKIRVNMFNRTNVHVTVNNNYTVEDGGTLIVNTTDETAEKIVEALNRAKRDPEQIAQETEQK